MRAKEFILEEVQNPQDIINMVFRDCRPYLERVNFKPTEHTLWRGFFQHIPTYQKFVRKPNRNPVDTPRFIHDTLNKYFLKHYGVAWRSDATFATGSKRNAQGYGGPYMFFPIGEFTFFWSSDIEDMANSVDEAFPGGVRDEFGERDLISWLDEKLFIMDDYFLNAIQSQNEVMIKCDSYYLVNPKCLVHPDGRPMNFRPA